MTTTVTDRLNSLLRGELSATETYQQALAKLGNTKGAPELRRVHAEHREAANTLRKHIHEHGGEPHRNSGAWGAFAKLVEGTATLLGAEATLKALKEGEEHGIKDYEAALREKTCPDDCKTLIASSLLPQTRAHVPVLERLMVGLVERITPHEARQHLASDPSALLVCAYDSQEKCRQNHLEGSISLDEFKSRAGALAKDREIIFYCA